MPHRTRIEVRDGVEYVVTTLPQDPRLGPAQTKKRTLAQAQRTRITRKCAGCGLRFPIELRRCPDCKRQVKRRRKKKGGAQKQT